MKVSGKTVGTNQLFLASLGMMAFFYGIKQIYVFTNNNIIEGVNDAVQVISYLLLLFIILKRSFKIKWFKYVAITAVIILIGLDHSRSTGILRWSLITLASRDMSYRKILKTLFRVYGAVLCISIVLYVLGLSNPIIVDDGISLGFSHPNIAALLITTELFLWLCLKEKVDWKSILIYFLFAATIHIFLETRVAAICLAFFPILYKVIQWGKKKDNKLIKILACYSQVIICVLSYLMVVIYPMAIYNPLRGKIDQLLAYRPYLNFNNIMKYGVSIWGQNVSIYNTTDYAFNYFSGYVSNQKFNTVDNAYILGLIATGIIPMLIMIICFVIVQKKAWKNGNTLLIAIGVMFAIYAFIENGANEALFVFPYYYLVAKDDTKIDKTFARNEIQAIPFLKRRYRLDT